MLAYQMLLSPGAELRTQNGSPIITINGECRMVVHEQTVKIMRDRGLLVDKGDHAIAAVVQQGAFQTKVERLYGRHVCKHQDCGGSFVCESCGGRYGWCAQGRDKNNMACAGCQVIRRRS